MHFLKSVRWSSFESRWVAEAIRLYEDSCGPLADAEAVAAVRAGPGSAEARILARAAMLGEREGMVVALAAWKSRARLVLVIASVLALASGFGVALAVLGDGTRVVNVVWALGGLLGVHLLSLALWGVGLCLNGNDAGGILGRAWVWLSARLSNAPVAAYVVLALAGLLGRGRLLRWWLGAVTHGVWLMALLGALVGLLISLSTRRYGFVWETTILSSEVFVELVQFVGWLPGQVGFAVPDAKVIHSSGGGAGRFDETARIVWSSWLVGCLATYGIAPRAVLWGVCVGLGGFGRARVRLDLRLPGYARLMARLAPESEPIGVTDADPGRGAGPRVADSHVIGNGAALLVGLELGPRGDWPPALPAGVRDAGVLDTRDQRKSLLAELRSNPPVRLLIVCDARQSPDRGSLELIAELSRHAGSCRVGLLGTEDGAHGRSHLDHWQEGLVGMGMNPAQIVVPATKALDWLGKLAAGHAND